MAMSDEERLVQAVADAFQGKIWGGNPAEGRLWAQRHIERLRARGVTLTPPPAPEPTYTITFPFDLYWMARSLVETSTHKSPKEGELLDALSDLLANATPDPEPWQ